MKTKSVLLIVLLMSLAGLAGAAQKRVEKPKVHADFHFGALPAVRDLSDLMAKEHARLIVVGYHNGWSVEKIAKELKLPENELTEMAEDLEEQRLAGQRTEYELRPFMPVFRERDIERLSPDLQRHTKEFAALLESNLQDIEKFVMSLPGGDGPAKDRLMYETVVSGLLLGGIVDALLEDKTMLPPGPRRTTRGLRAYAWMVESNPALAGKLKREARESDNYQIISIGADFPKTRISLDELRSSNADVFDETVARRYRTFVALLCRDKVLPFFKARRSELLKLAAIPESAKYVVAAEFFGWYYNAMANGVVDQLVASGKIKPPVEQYTYAIRNPVQ